MGSLETLVSTISFADLTAAMVALFGAMATVGILLKGGNVVLRKLGFK